ncbi:MAG: aa3-type cytochrome c oxidase subunit IV [Xanthobacteraceae bacterium]
MVEHGVTEYETAAGNDYEQHEATYLHFIQLLKWSAVALVVLLALMAFFLT